MDNLSGDVVKKRRVAIYIRVSTQEQKIDGYGLESQRKRLLSYINENKALNLCTQDDWIFEDVHTGSEMSREALQRLLKAVDEKKFDAVLVWKIDRLSRSLKHLLDIFERLQRAGASFISLQENIDFNGAIGNLIFQIFGAIAQFERELIKSRTRAGILASAEMGNYTGTRIPYGYRPIVNPMGKGKRLEIVPDEKKWVEKIFHWYIYEDMGYGQVAKKLNDLKVPQSKYYNRSVEGGWTMHRVEDIIQNPLYRGEFLANTKNDDGSKLPEHEWTTVAVPPCVSEMIYLLAQQKRSERKSAHKIGYVYLLSGKLYDVSLPHQPKFSGKPRTKGGRSYRRKQFVKDGVHHPVFEIPTEPIEKAAWEKVRLALKNPEIFIKEYFNHQQYGKSRLDDMNEELLKLREQKANHEMKISRIEDAYENGSYGQEKLSQKTSEAQTEIDILDRRIDEIRKELSIASLKDAEIAGLRKAAEAVNYNLDNLTRKQKKILLDLFIDRVEMNRNEIPSEGKRSKWAISARVIFRFVPEKFNIPNNVGRTQKELEKANTPKKIPLEKESGGRTDGGYNLFFCDFSLDITPLTYEERHITGGRFRVVANEQIRRELHTSYIRESVGVER